MESALQRRGAAVTGYRVQVSADHGNWRNLSANTRSTATSYSHTNLAAGSTRHYRVAAINAAGAGPWSSVATGTTAQPPPPASGDRAALVALYNATDGANWHTNTNWLSNVPLGDWHGVFTNSGRVTTLILRDNRLSGSIPEELGDLSRLTRLALSSNQLTGSIPEELGNLSSLQYLWLNYNDLTGEIPEELGNLSSLRWLYLAYNQFTGCIPESLRDLPSVTNNDLGTVNVPFCGS